ncbi:TetR/AcrR family transcriptional regulator C-terminal domain-containing protein [Microbispora hainanensis]|uniref:GntR family transcriptional regulator n=1 Tax=Microbispora hainanensis TaxID=568844 RepID=A0A544YUT0_9ACTN|nr:TetR/AcrR family transcriptional regulator C-terminal domain-containing protein [Microbispora hainanensis]TQS20531.1 GntR family transcriptional regulator [Microbispora hainanensis]
MSGPGAGRYQEIAAEIRGRIEAGELRPGDRVPSTREIVREWGVAMATATKVLTELRREGLVHAVPGVGTVVGTVAGTGGRAVPPSADGRGEAASEAASAGASVRARRRTVPDGALTPDSITATAVAVADAEGLEAVSMRRVAAELGVATMSLYRHVADKDTMLLQMMEAVFGRMRFPEQPPPHWRSRIELAARMLWATFRRHPWLAPAMSVTRPQLIPSALPFMRWVLGALDGRGLDAETTFTAYITVFNHIRGTAINLEFEAEAEALTGLDADAWMDARKPAFEAITAGGGLPLFERLHAAGGYDFDMDALFEFGLQRLLDGIAALLAGAR